MNMDKLKEIWEKVKTAVGKVSKKVWIIAAVTLVLIAAGITVYLNTRPYSVLITGATPGEVTTVINWLEGRGVTTYRYQGNDTILVPDRQAASLKASLLTELYSTGTSDFSGYFENAGMLSTEKARTNAWYVALRQRFESVISSMEGVQSATVEITEGQDRGYVLDASNVVEASASVKVTMQPGRSMSSKLASAIREYVSHGVQGLTVENVTVMDSYGNVFSAGSMDGSADSSLLKLQMEEEYNNKARTSVMQVLSPFYGEDGVRVAVNTTIELANSTVTSHEPYIPEYVTGRENGEGIIGSWVWGYQYNASDGTTQGGLVGPSSNSDIVTDVERQPGTDEVDGKVEGNGQKDYNNPYTDTQTVYTAGRVKDCTVSVSIDSARTQDGYVDMDALRSMVAHAVGITPVVTDTMTAQEYLAGKITIYSGPFYRAPEVPGPVAWWQSVLEVVPWWAFAAAGGGLLLFIILLAVILSIRSKRRKKQREEEALEQLQQQQQLAAELLAAGMPQMEAVGADVMSLQTEKSMALRQDIRQFAEENPEVAAQLIRSWLRGGEEGG